MSIPRTLLVAVVAVVAIAIPANAFALDHVTLTTTPITVPAAAKKKKKLPLCKKHQKSTKKHPCRKRKRTTAAADVQQNAPVPWSLQLIADLNPDGSWTAEAVLQRKVGNAIELHEYTQNVPTARRRPDAQGGTGRCGPAR